MKILFSLIAIMIASTTYAQNPNLSANGEKAGNGGGEVELDIASLLPRLNRALQQNCKEIPAFYRDPMDCWSDPYVNLITLTTDLTYATKNDLIKVKIKAVKGPLYEKTDTLKKSPKTALNFPELNLIHIDMDRWEKITETRKLGILAHELIGVTNSSIDFDYEISKTLVNLIEEKKWVCFGYKSSYVYGRGPDGRLEDRTHGKVYDYDKAFYGYGVDRVKALENLKRQCKSAAIGIQRTEGKPDTIIYSNIENACFLNQ